MIFNNNFSSYLTQKLRTLSANNITKSGSLSFGSLTSMNKYMEILTNTSTDVSKIDYNAIMKALESGSLDELGDQNTQNVASILNEILAIKDISEMADVSGDGTIDASEMETLIGQLAGADGDNKTLSFDDINKLFDQLGLNLDEVAETAIQDAIEEAAEEQEIPEEEKVQQKEQAQTPEQASSPSSSGGTSPSNSAGGVNSQKSTENTEKAETPDEIKAKIAEKEDEISQVESDAESEISQIEEEKNKELESLGLTDKQLEDYKNQEEDLDTKIKAKEDKINDKDNEISDYKSTISSNESYISSLDNQIQDNKNSLDKISDDDKDAASKRSDFQTKISNLENEKSKIKEENDNLQQKLDKAEDDKKQLQAEKDKIENDKTNLLSKILSASNKSDAEKTKIQENIKEYDNKIAEVKSQKNEKISSLKNDIQDLQVKLKNAEAEETRSAFLKENKATNGLGLSGEELVDVAKQMLAKYGESHGYCATGVSRTFAMAYGLNLHGNGCDWDTNMDKLVEQGAFEEVTSDYATSADLAKLPAGAVVCWEATGGTSGGAKYGHVTIADGKGGEISDHYVANIYKSIGGRSDQYRVYIPV